MRITLTLLALAAGVAGAQPVIRWEPYSLPAGTRGLTAELGRMTVPLVRSAPASGTAEIVFVRLRGEPRGDGAPILYLEGGPGQPASPAARNAYAIPSLASMARVADVILFDQRGTGLSTPRPVCAAASLLEPAAHLPPAREFAEASTAALRACITQWKDKGVDVHAFTNRESAADVNDLRQALGVPRINLEAYSYGTHLALAVLRYFGAGVERATLIGTAGPNDMRKLPWVSDAQVARLAMFAARDPAIAADVPDMRALLQRVIGKLEREPLPVTVYDVARKREVEIQLGADAFRRIMMQDLGDANDLPVFPALLATMDRGDLSILSAFVERRYNESSGASNLMYYGMRCSAGATATRDAEISREAASSMFANAMNAPFPDVCSALPADMDLGDDYRGLLTSDRPVLFVSGTLDNNTPPFQAEQLRWGMPFATNLVVENAGHEDYLPNERVQEAIRDFFRGQDVAGRRIVLPFTFRSIEAARQKRQRPKRGD